MMTYQLVVVRCRSVRTPDMKQYMPGEMLPESACSPERAQHLLNRGFLRIVETGVAQQESAPAGVAGGEPDDEVVVIVDEQEGDVVVVENDDPRAIGRVSPTPWDFTEDMLKGKPLEELNAIVVERDASVEPFTTVEEAVAFLCQDADLKAS